MEEISELLDKDEEELTDEDLTALEEERRNTTEEEEEEELQRMFTVKRLSEGLSQVNKHISHFESMNLNIEQFARIERMVLDAFCPYREIYADKKTNHSDET